MCSAPYKSAPREWYPHRMQRGTKVCDHCGETLSATAIACPECGSDAQTGWADEEEIQYQSVDLPDLGDAPEWSPTQEARGDMPGWVRITAWAAAAGFLILLLSRLFR